MGRFGCAFRKRTNVSVFLGRYLVGITYCPWVLAGIGQIPVIRDALVCKGGTALKECCFEDYYF